MKLIHHKCIPRQSIKFAYTISMAILLLPTICFAQNTSFPSFQKASFWKNELPLGQGVFARLGKNAPKPVFYVPTNQIVRDFGSSVQIIDYKRTDSSASQFNFLNSNAQLTGNFILSSMDTDFTLRKDSSTSNSNTIVTFRIMKIIGVENFRPDLGALELESDFATNTIGTNQMKLEDFNKKYGTGFINERFLGAEMDCIASVEFANKEDEVQFKVDIEGSGLGSHGHANLDSLAFKYGQKARVTVEVNKVGGAEFNPDLKDITLSDFVGKINDFIGGVSPTNAHVIGYNVLSYESLSGLEQHLAGKIPTFSEIELQYEMHRLLIFGAALRDLKSAVSNQPPQFTVGTNSYDRQTALIEIADTMMSLRKAIEIISKNEHTPTPEETADTPQLNAISKDSALNLLKKYGKLRVEKTGFQAIPFDLAKGGQNVTADKRRLDKDEEIDSHDDKWTRVTLSQSIDTNATPARLNIRYEVTEGAPRFRTVIHHRGGKAGPDPDPIDSSERTEINPRFKDANDTQIFLSYTNELNVAGLDCGKTKWTLAKNASSIIFDTSSQQPGHEVIFRAPQSIESAFADSGVMEWSGYYDGGSHSDLDSIKTSGKICLKYSYVLETDGLLDDYLLNL